jgi:hypothetical protein
VMVSARRQSGNGVVAPRGAVFQEITAFPGTDTTILPADI